MLAISSAAPLPAPKSSLYWSPYEPDGVSQMLIHTEAGTLLSHIALNDLVAAVRIPQAVRSSSAFIIHGAVLVAGDCVGTKARSVIDRADIVVFYGRTNMKPFPTIRRPTGTLWAFQFYDESHRMPQIATRTSFKQ